MHGLENAAENLHAAGVQMIWIDGSFVTSKKEPNDVDGCWEYTERVDLARLDAVFLAESRTPMKMKYRVEFFPAFVIEAGSGLPFPKFFQVNRDGDPKGILVVSFAQTSRVLNDSQRKAAPSRQEAARFVARGFGPQNSD
jgi:hypothetical protein